MFNPQKNLDKHINDLLNKVGQVQNIDLEDIKKAITLGSEIHREQYRKTGDYYFVHPLRVAMKAAEYDLDGSTIISSLLHDSIEDTVGEKAKQRVATIIQTTFGDTVFKLVQALTKVKENQNLTLYKIIQLGRIDFRVILIKLLDRLDNLSDLRYLSRGKQRRICRETVLVYSQIANGLGLIDIEEMLNDAVFKLMYPTRYIRIADELNQFYVERQIAINQIIDSIKTCIQPDLLRSIKAQFVQPHEYLYDRSEIVRILNSILIKTTDPMGCYQILGAIHTHFRSVPQNINDYISNPKANGWRGLTTKVIINGEQIKIEIVTSDFHENNRKGILTLINEGIYRSEDYKEFLQLYIDVAVDNIRIEDVFRATKTKTIQTMTPGGDVIELRYGATIIDFAFMVHTELGLRCRGGIIKDVRYPRNKILEDGMVVRVIKSDSITPELSWIDDVVMPKSRREIIKYLHQNNKS